MPRITTATPPAASRNLAVDAFRGLTIALMVMVNNPGSYSYVYHPLQHSHWHGCTLADFVFPFFLLICGISIAYSLSSRKTRSADRLTLIRSAVLRGAKLFGLGLLANNFPFYNVDWRIPGVLQRIAIVYFLSILIATRFSLRRIAGIAALLLAGYWALLALMPVPGVGSPDLSSPTANIVAWLDHKLLGSFLYNPDDGWDPEGLLSTIPALCLSLIGVLAGRLMIQTERLADKINTLFTHGLLLAAGGLVWKTWLPFNRWLWTSSFMLFAAGLGLMALAGCLAIGGRPRLAALLTPFQKLGANAIAVYMGSMIFSKILYMVNFEDMNLHDLLQDSLFSSWLSTPDASLGWAVAFTLSMLLISHWLHARRIFIKI